MIFSRKTRSTTRRAQAQHAPNVVAKPRLPAEIINIIVGFSSPEAQVKIVSLNRWFNQTFGTILYQHIELHTARQLVQLFRSKNATKSLTATKALTIGRHALWKESWKEVHGRLEPAEYLGRVLQMTTSLVELTIRRLSQKDNVDWEYEYLFIKEICKRALDPSFLPHLARLETHCGFERLQLLHHGRPLECIYYAAYPDEFGNNPAIIHHPAGISPSRLSFVTTIFLWTDRETNAANELVNYLKYCVAVVSAVRHLVVKACCFHDNIERCWDSFELMVLAWILALSSHGVCNNLDSFYFVFSPPLRYKPLGMLHHMLDEIARLIPNLAYVVIGTPDVQWHRQISKQAGAVSELPDWTPCPSHHDPGILPWWFETMGISVLEATGKGNSGDAAVRVRNTMLTRWPDKLVPSLEVLQTRMPLTDSSSTTEPCPPTSSGSIHDMV